VPKSPDRSGGRYAGWRILQHEADRAFRATDIIGQEKLRRRWYQMWSMVGSLLVKITGQDQRAGRYSEPVISISAAPPAVWPDRRVSWRRFEDGAAAKRQRLATSSDMVTTLSTAWWGPDR
jgi:hypothetical protein